MFCSLREEGRSGWEGRVKNGVRMKHMITVDKIELVLLTCNILVIYNYFDFDNIIGLFSIGPHIVIAVLTLQYLKLLILTFCLLNFVYRFCTLINVFFCS